MRNCFHWIEAISAVIVLFVAGCASKQDTFSQYSPPLFDTRPAQRPRIVTPAPAPLPPPLAKTLAGVVLVVDAGHGGRDPGALGVGPMYEKGVNLGIATRLRQLLEMQGAAVTMTRSDDRFIELDNRAAMADQRRADLFVSIHADSAANANASGTTIYIARSASQDSSRAAEHIASAFRQSGIECRGVRRADYRVLAGHARPAVLIECGFLTNRREATMLSTPAYQSDLASAIAQGIINSLGR